MKKTKLFFVRHGESLANAEHIYLGHLDWDLSELGKQQARTTAEFLADEPFSAIYSSDLIRAYNTAIPHSEIHNLPILKSRELREIFLGDWEGLPHSTLEEKYYDEYFNGWRARFGEFTPPNGEPIQTLARRIYNEALRIAKAHVGETVLITTHAAAIRSFWGLITKTEPKNLAEQIPFPSNASFSTVYFNGEELAPGEYSCDAHIKLKTHVDA